MAHFRVKELAQARGLTQETLAIKSGVTMRSVQRLWQNKVQRVDMMTLIKVADALRVDIRELYATDDAESRESTHRASMLATGSSQI